MQRPIEKKVFAGFIAGIVLFVVIVALVWLELRRVEGGTLLATAAILGSFVYFVMLSGAYRIFKKEAQKLGRARGALRHQFHQGPRRREQGGCGELCWQVDRSAGDRLRRDQARSSRSDDE